jgi:hypothetical protein
MKSTHRHPLLFCGMRIIIKPIMLVLNTYYLGNQERLPFIVLMLVSIRITPLLFSYCSFKIWYGFTIDENCSLLLLSFLQTYPSLTFMLLYRAFHIWCIGLVYKISYAVRVESVLKDIFATEYSKGMHFLGMTCQSDINDNDNFSFDMILR